MPQIVVTSNPAERGQNSEVMLRERVGAADFESAHFKAQLLERLGWAVGDAHAAERLPTGEDDTAGARDVGDPPARRDADGRPGPGD